MDNTLIVYKEKYKVRCKNFRVVYYNYTRKEKKMINHLGCDKTDCLNKIGPIKHCGEFEVDWIKFLLYNNILFSEIKD